MRCHRRPQGRPGGKPEHGLRSKREDGEVDVQDLCSVGLADSEPRGLR